MNATHKYCILGCEAGLFYNLNEKYCQYCDSSCATCSVNNSAVCTSCAKSDYSLEEGNCVSACSDDYIQIKLESNNYCIPNNACTCPKLYDFISESCVNECPDTTFPFKEAITYYCLDCSTGC